MEKRNIQISLKEAREWYNSGDSFKKELTLKAYKEEELNELSYLDIRNLVYNSNIKEYEKNLNKTNIYKKLLTLATYLNSIYKKEYYNGCRIYFYIKPKNLKNLPKEIEYKSFKITNTILKNDYTIYFNSLKAAKQAIDILGDDLNILFE